MAVQPIASSPTGRHPSAPTGAAPASKPIAWKWAGWAVTALAIATRAPLVGRSLGEADCARYLVGLEQWLRHGATAPFIYGKVFSPLYYTLAAWLVRTIGVEPVTLLRQISLWTAVLSAPLLFWFGCRLTNQAVAAAGTGLLLMAPGFWWLGIEPHPQAASFLCLLLALCAALRAHDQAGLRQTISAWLWRAAAAAAFGLGLLLKNDLILYAAVFPALDLRGSGDGGEPNRWPQSIRAAGRSLLIPIAGGVIFLLGRTLLLGMAWQQAQRQTHAAVREFLVLPHGVDLIKQLLPMLTSPGVALTLLTLTGVAMGCLAGGSDARAWRRRWGWPLLAWALPQMLFWGMIRGNNDCHMATYLLLPAWAALETLTLGPGLWVRRKQARPRHGHFQTPRRLRGVQLACICVIVVVINLALVPPSSNNSLYASADVPASVHDLAARTADLRNFLAAGLAQTPLGSQACFLGNATLPYLEWILLQQRQAVGPFPLAAFGSGPASQMTANGISADFIEVNSPAEFRRAARQCRQAGAGVWSLEYTPTALHEQFLGREWHTLPFAQRWYPGGR